MSGLELNRTGRSSDPDAVIPRMRRLLERLVGRRKVRHAVVVAADLDAGWQWSEAMGAANLEGDPMHPETPWFLASVTKLHIAAVVIRLHEQGLLDLSAPIADALPAGLSSRLHVIDGTDHTSRLTPIHLLGHLSGLPDYLDERPPGARSLMEEVTEDGDRGWTPVEAVERARDRLAPHFPPSDPRSDRPKVRYSDTNFQLLMVMAEHIGGNPMSRLYQDLIFGPLELRQTWLPGAGPPDPIAEPATLWLADRPLVNRPLAMRSFGDLYSTGGDLVRFGRALVVGDVFEDPGSSAMMWRRFHRFGFPRGMASLRAPGWPIEYGLGMMRFQVSRWLAGGMRIPPVVGHTGSTGSWLWYCPQLRLLTAGTVDQTSGATVPFRLVPRALAGLSRE